MTFEDTYSAMFSSIVLKVSFLINELSGAAKSNMFTAVGYFLQHVALKGIDSVAKLFHVKSEAEYFTPREVDRYNRLANIYDAFTLSHQ